MSLACVRDGPRPHLDANSLSSHNFQKRCDRRPGVSHRENCAGRFFHGSAEARMRDEGRGPSAGWRSGRGTPISCPWRHRKPAEIYAGGFPDEIDSPFAPAYTTASRRGQQAIASRQGRLLKTTTSKQGTCQVGLKLLETKSLAETSGAL